MRAGRFFLPAPGDGVITPVYIDDLVDAIVRAVRRTARGRARVHGLGRRAGQRARVLLPPRAHARHRGPLPAAPAAARRPARRRAGAPEAADRPGALTFVSRRAVFPNTRAREELGWSPAVGLDEGMRRTEAWAREAGLLAGRRRDRTCAMETVTLERRGAELRITLDRPDTMNAWDKQLGLDLLAAVREAEADDDVRAVVITGAGRGFSSGADLKAGFDPTPEGHPDVETALRERYHPIITGLRRLPKPVLAAVNGPAVGIGCSLALACDLIVARESAYFLLAFVNIGLVPDGGSSLLVPGARRLHARGRDGDARRADPGAPGARVGPDQPRRRRRRVRRRRRRARGAPGGRPDGGVRGRQGAAQRVAVRAHGRPARARGQRSSSARPPRATSKRACWRSWRSGRPPSPAGERPLPAPASIYCRRRGPAAAQDPAPPSRAGCRRAGGPAGSARAGPHGVRRMVPAAVRRLAERGRDPDALHPDRADRAGDLHPRRGPADLLDDQVPRAQGRGRGADPRQHAARDRLDRRRRRDPDLPDRVHVRPARRHQEPGGVADRRRRQPGERLERAVRLDRPAGAADGQRVAEDRGDRPAVRVDVQLPVARGEARLRLQRHVRADRDDGGARHQVDRRRALVVDPDARRQDGRGPGLHEQDLVQDPARQRSRRARAGSSTRASAPSCAGATTPTWSRA